MDRAVMIETEQPSLWPSPPNGVRDASEDWDGSDAESLGIWRALLIGLAVDFLACWGPLGVLLWRWIR
jgi:hypothetical protein